ncbi:MAG: molybdenum cofactor guanylyltransferase [Cyanobacteriota bacterium]|nr:molybdenum cofactor guanylyltransferase [Cyanobacteriota bacterium]
MTDTGSALPLRICLLSGGESRRMGQDKALLPHPEGGCWLERTLRLLARLDAPVTLLSRHPRHLAIARQLQEAEGHRTTGEGAVPAPRRAAIHAIGEPAPWEGPLLALHRLMQLHPDRRLLLCPVDMPSLSPEVLRQLLEAAAADPTGIHLAHDGRRRQPLLGIYPSSGTIRALLASTIAGGERRLQGWLAGQPCREVRLDAERIRNHNRPEDLARPNGGAREGEGPAQAGRPERDDGHGT